MGRIVRRVRQSGVYFVTTDTWLRRALFHVQETARILLEHLLECRARGFFKLHAFVIMPEHLHILLTPGADSPLTKSMQMIKGGAAHKIHQAKGGKFPVWHSGYHDRWMRNAEEYRSRKRYIEQNPLKARLVECDEDYEFGSASGRYAMDASQFD